MEQLVVPYAPARLKLEQQPDFVALHFQEVGGSNWKKGSLDLVQPLTDAIARETADMAAKSTEHQSILVF